MPNRTLKAIFLIATCCFSTWALAQNAYKCGDTYNQTPCPGAVAIDATDKRSSEQKTQADDATHRNSEAARVMEKARLEQEKKDLAVNTPPAKPVSGDAPDATSPRQVSQKKKKKTSPYFTAQVPGQKKKKKHAAGKKDPEPR